MVIGLVLATDAISVPATRFFINSIFMGCAWAGERVGGGLSLESKETKNSSYNESCPHNLLFSFAG